MVEKGEGHECACTETESLQTIEETSASCSIDSIRMQFCYGRYTEVSGDQDVEPAGASGKLAAAGELRGPGGEGGRISPATWGLHSGRDHPGNRAGTHPGGYMHPSVHMPTSRDLTEFSLSKVKKSLCVLIHHQLVGFETRGGGGGGGRGDGGMLYQVNLSNLLLRVRFPRYIHTSKELFGDAGELIVEDLLQQGQSLMSQVSATDTPIITHQQNTNQRIGLCRIYGLFLVPNEGLDHTPIATSWSEFC